MAGRALAGSVSQTGVSDLPALAAELAHVALIDYGVKSSIVRILRESGARVTIFPWDASAADILENYLNYLRNIVDKANGGHVQPVYGVGYEPILKERIVDSLPGYTVPGFQSMGPVRVEKGQNVIKLDRAPGTDAIFAALSKLVSQHSGSRVVLRGG